MLICVLFTDGNIFSVSHRATKADEYVQFNYVTTETLLHWNDQNYHIKRGIEFGKLQHFGAYDIEHMFGNNCNDVTLKYCNVICQCLFTKNLAQT